MLSRAGALRRRILDAAAPLVTLAAVFRLLWSVDRGAVAVSLAAAATGLVTSGLLLYFVRSAFSLLVGPGGSIWPLVGLVLVIGLQQAMNSLLRTAETMLRQETSTRLNTRLLAKLETVPFDAFEDNAFQAEYGLLVREASYRPAFMIDSLVGGVASATAVLGILAGLAAVVSPLALVLLVLVGPGIWLETRYRRRLIDLQTMASPDLLRMQFVAQQSVDASWQRDLRVYHSSLLTEEYSRLGDGYLTRLRQVALRLQTGSLVVGLLEVVWLGAALAGTVVLVRSGLLTAVAATVMITGLYLALTQSRSLSTTAGGLVESLGYADRLFAFLRRDFSEAGSRNGRAALAGALDRPPPVVSRVRVSGLTFRYPGSGRAALETVSCELGIGLTAVVGPNGAGKSTLLRILAGLSPPTSGSVELVDGGGRAVPLAAVPRAVLFQQATHFRLTVRQNVTMAPQEGSGSEDDERRIEAALAEAGLLEVVRGLPRGLDTPVGLGFGGFTDLSGGQWQRLSLARLIYHEAPLVLLDEPAASLDPEGESRLLALLRDRWSRSRIVVVVTHRYETAAACDRILVLSDGQLVEQGRPGELVTDGRAFFRLFLSR